MAKSITQRISLVGGKGIEAQLRAIGEAGQQAFARFRAAADTEGPLRRLASSVDSVRAKASALANDTKSLGDNFGLLGSRVTSAVRNITLAVGAVTAASAGFVGLVKSAGNTADELEDVGSSVGMTAKNFSDFRYAAQLSSVGADRFTKGMLALNNQMAQAQKRTEDNAKARAKLHRELSRGEITLEDYNKRIRDMNEVARDNQTTFQKLGVSILNQDGSLRESNGVLLDLADAFKAMPNAVERSTTAMELFGTRNATFVNFVGNGSKALQQLTRDAQRVAPPLGDLERKAGTDLNDAFDRLSAALKSTRDHFFVTFAPPLTRLIGAIVEKVVAVRGHMLGLAEAMNDRLKPIIGDIIALLEGRDSDVSNNFIIQARDAVTSFGTAVRSAVTGIVIPAFRAFLAVLETVATAVNNVFGTKFTGGQIAAALAISKLVGLFGLLGSSITVVVGAAKVLFGIFSVGFAALPGIIAVAQIALTGLVAGVTALAAALATPIGLIAALGAAIGFLVVTAVQKLGGLSAIWAAIANGAKTAAETIKSGFSGAIGAVVAGFAGIGGLIADALNSLVQTVGGVWEAIRAKAAEVGTGITGVFNTAVQTVVGYFNSLRDRVMAIFDSVISAAKNVLAAVKAALSGGSGSGSGGKAPGFSRGGHVRGPGTGTSDSIPAYLSDGEFVIPAKAVRYYGVRVFEALRRMQAPLSAIGQRFANGGLVSAAQALMPPVPRFANGGLVSSALVAESGSGGRTVNLNIGGQSFGMRTDEDTARRLERHAAAKNLRSSGRKPSWVR